MEEQLNDPEKKPPRGGPQSPEGKERSKMNRLTHGCRSEKTVLRDEDPAEFEFIVEAWFEQYEPLDGIAVMLVKDTALAHWFFKRARRRLEAVEYELPADPNHWPEAGEKRFDRHMRYKTTAERSFFRHFKELEAHYDRMDRMEDARRLAKIKSAAIEMQWVTRKQEKTFEELKVEQVAEVQLVQGECRTTYYPTNEQIVEAVAKQPRAPLYIRRWINFPNGVPAEYAWSNPNIMQREVEARGSQTMLYPMWLQVIEKEKATGHIGPIWT